jgi:hypothetical protein
MQVTSKTSIQTILAAHPKAVSIFSKHGLENEFLSNESMLWTEMELCKRLGPNPDLDALLSDLQQYIDSRV